MKLFNFLFFNNLSLSIFFSLFFSISKFLKIIEISYELKIKSKSPLIVFLAKSSFMLFMIVYIAVLISKLTGGLYLKTYSKNLMNTVGLNYIFNKLRIENSKYLHWFLNLFFIQNKVVCEKSHIKNLFRMTFKSAQIKFNSLNCTFKSCWSYIFFVFL